VDDDASVVMMCTEILQEAGFEAEGTSGGTEAIERCQKEDFDLLLIDLKMPGLNGLEVLRAVKESDPDIAAIIITGYGTLESAVEAMRLGAQEVQVVCLETRQEPGPNGLGFLTDLVLLEPF